MNQDLEVYFQPISEDTPCGIDLEYDPEFAKMEKAAHGTPEQEIGSTRIEAIPPDWEEVLDVCESLLAKSKDLRVTTYYTTSKLVVQGLPGLRDGLKVTSTFLSKFWESVFPLLDEEDDNDPMSRVNAMLGLSTAGGLIRMLRETPIVASRSVGRFSVVDCGIARGDLPVPPGMAEPPTQKKIDAAVQTCDLQELKRNLEATEESIQQIAAIDNTFIEHAGYGSGPNLELLLKELKGILKFLKGWLEGREPIPAPASESSSKGENTGIAAISPKSETLQTIERPFVMGAGSFEIGRREDALEGLDKIIRWFERYEPSSPLPMLLKRAKRLSNLSFIEILKDISPDGLSQAAMVGGSQALEESREEEEPPEEDSEPPRNSNRPVDDDY